MLEIYFDGILIGEDNYKSLTNDFSLFNNEFRLGTTSANTFKLEVPSSIPTPQQVLIQLDGVDYANLIVDSISEVNKNFYSLTLTDSMTSFNFDYDASTIVPCTVLEILEDICNRVNITLNTTSFINSDYMSDYMVDWWDSRVQARTYIGYIAELAGGYAQIGQDGELYIKTFGSASSYSIDINTCEEFDIKEHHQIERVVFDNGLLKYETDVNEQLETLYLNPENVFINDEDTFNNIANEILGFDYYCFTTGKCEVNPEVIAGDKLVFSDGTNNYNTIAQYSLKYFGQWLGGYSLDLKSQRQLETKQIGFSERVKNLSITIDRTRNEINLLVEELNDQYNQLSSLTQNVEGFQFDVQASGGINLIRNSVGFNGTEWWDVTGTVNTSQNTLLLNSTLSGSAFVVSNGSASQTINTIVGTEYNLTFKYTQTIANCYVKVTSNQEWDVLTSNTATPNMTEVSFNFTALSEQTTIEFGSDDDNLTISDLIIGLGNLTLQWQPNAKELYGAGIAIDVNGIKITSLNNDFQTLINSQMLQITNFSNNTVMAQFTKDGATVENLMVNNNMAVNKYNTISGITVSGNPFKMSWLND